MMRACLVLIVLLGLWGCAPAPLACGPEKDGGIGGTGGCARTIAAP